ncbi:class I SAM-dependent methyltransferase [Pseudogracilibacillus auburnensis]|uniref:class I SAM-dependent methyltransferase n=1 Tax=Pseudogracilibacillus auburnensis TaxID=1494959 RepID=UPI001F615F0C|nr:class I SAM-dependent methyltransferase [Pseudogracilibacillus auburnensis]
MFDVMNQMIQSSWRKDLLKNLQGNILEVGVGTGANLSYYPSNVHVTGIDFSPKMLMKAYEKIDKAEVKVVLREMDAQDMDFPDNTFDAVVSTYVFCSIPNPVKGFKEIRRVVKPEGKIVMLEHMRSENVVAGKILDLMNPLTVRIVGANVNRKTIENIEKAGLRIEQQKYLMTSIMRKIIISPNK